MDHLRSVPPRSVISATNAKSAFPSSSSNFLLFFCYPPRISHFCSPSEGTPMANSRIFFDPHFSRPLRRVGAHWSCLSLCLLWEDVLTSVFMRGTWETLCMPLHTKNMDRLQCRLGWCFTTSVSSPSCSCASSPSVLALKSFICTHSWWNPNHRKSRSPRIKAGAGGDPKLSLAPPCHLRSCFAPEFALCDGGCKGLITFVEARPLARRESVPAVVEGQVGRRAGAGTERCLGSGCCCYLRVFLAEQCC